MLFAILVVACTGLLWATVAAARYIRQARRRHRKLIPQSLGRQTSPAAGEPSGQPRTHFPRAKQLQTHF